MTFEQEIDGRDFRAGRRYTVDDDGLWREVVDGGDFMSDVTITDGYRCVARSQLRGVKLRLVFKRFNIRQANVAECSQVRGCERKIRVGRVVRCEHGRVHPNELRSLLCYRHLQL
jgi:hypothetical protein